MPRHQIAATPVAALSVAVLLCGALAVPTLAQTAGDAPAETPTAGAPGAEAPIEGALPMEFSPTLSGMWEGRGEVFANMEQERPFNVRCDLNVDATDTTFALDGECGALFVKRPIRVTLEREGDAITGTYDADLRTGLATLEGAETDGAIEMEITWGGEVNGDLTADMRIVREGEDGLRIVFTDIDPATGEDRTTSDLVLERG